LKNIVLAFFLTALSSPTFAAGPRPALAKPYLVAPITIDNQNVGEAWVFPRDERKNFALEAAAILEALRPILAPDIYQRLENRKSVEKTLSLADLDSLGLSSTFSESTLELTIRVPLKSRQQNELSLNYSDVTKTKPLTPTQQSGYLNFRFNQAYSDTKMPLTGNLQFVENIQGFAFESGADYQEHDTHAWRRTDTRLIKDNEEQMLRYTLGDLNVPSRGFQSSPAMGGFAVTREFSIQPYRTARPVSQHEIQIKRPSLVEVYVNNQLYSQLRLPPGRFDVRDFPLISGQNNVRVKIKDDLGQEESFDFSLLFENTILNQDFHEFSYNFGAPWIDSGSDRAYENEKIFTSVFHRMGLTNYVTGGINFQNYLSQNLTGAELSFISDYGYVSIDGAYSQTQSTQSGGGQKIRYRTLDRMFNRDVRTVLTAEFEKQDRGFRGVSVIPSAINAMDQRYDLQINHDFRWLYAGMGAAYEKQYDTEAKRIYRGQVVIPFTPWMRFEVSYNKSYGATEEERTLLSFFWSERQGLSTVSSYYDSQAQTFNVSAIKNSLYDYDDYRLRADLTTAANNTRTLHASGEYLTQPATLRLDQFSTRNDLTDQSITTLGVNTGLAWVGSQWALTQPINDSFALISLNDLPPGQALKVNPYGDGAQAQLGPRKQTILRNLTAYYIQPINLDATSLPVGSLLKREYFAVKSTYRSGILIDGELSQKIAVRGCFLKEDGAPISYASGEIFNEQNQLVDNTLFTTQDGRFYVEGLEPGTYALILDGFLAYTIRVQKPNETPVMELGTIKLKRGEE